MATDKSKFSTYLPKAIEDRLKIWMAERKLRSVSTSVSVILSEYFGLEKEEFKIASFATRRDLEKLVGDVDMIEAELATLEKKVETLESGLGAK